MATLPGVPLYVAFGFSQLEQLEITLEDGVKLECVSMGGRSSRPFEVEVAIGRNCS